MPIQQNASGNSIELLVSGKIDGALANEMETVVLEAIKTGAQEIYINLSGADFICSAGIRVIMQYWRQMKNQGKTLLVTRPSPPVEQILEMTGFKDAVVESTNPRP